MAAPSENQKKSPIIPRQTSYNSLPLNPLTDSSRHNRSSSEGVPTTTTLAFHLSQQAAALTSATDKENAPPPALNVPAPEAGDKDEEKRKLIDFKCPTSTSDRISGNNGNSALKPTSLQLCMQSTENVFKFGSKMRDPIEDSEHSNSVNMWDYSDSEAAPASSWSTLPNRTLLYRPLPLDIGRCACVIVREKSPEGLDGGFVYSLYTNEGQGRQNRKLAVAYYRRSNGRSQFIVAQNIKGILCPSDDSFLGTVTANLMGSRYCIWDQGKRLNSSTNKSRLLQAVVKFMPTIATWTGSYRRMIAWVPKHQSMQLKGLSQAQHMAGLPEDWESQVGKVQQLFSRAPLYNKMSKQYELEFRNSAKGGLRIQSSVKNFQLTMEKNGRQTIVQLGRVGKSKYVMDYRYPLTGYQAFCICLASMDSKLCCTV